MNRVEFLKVIIKDVCKIKNLTEETRKKEYVTARKLFSLITYDFKIIKTHEEIAKHVNKDRTNIVHYIKESRGHLLRDKDFAKKHRIITTCLSNYDKLEDENKSLADFFYKMHLMYARKHQETAQKEYKMCATDGCTNRARHKDRATSRFCPKCYSRKAREKDVSKYKYNRLKSYCTELNVDFQITIDELREVLKANRVFMTDIKYRVLIKDKKQPVTISNLRIQKVIV